MAIDRPNKNQTSSNNYEHTKTPKLAQRTAPPVGFRLIVCLAFTLASARADADKFLLISFDEAFTGDTTIDGTTTVSGAFSDKGPRHQDNTILSVSSDGSQVLVTGTVTINGSKGILTTQYTGTIQFDATNIAYIRGTEFITGGTGIYAGAREAALRGHP